MQTKKILVTGGSGFLMKNLLLKYPNYEWVAPRSSEVNWVTGVGIDTLPKVDIVIHSAAVYGGIVFNQLNAEKILLDNTFMNARVFEYILKNKPSKVIIIGSGCCYPGDAQNILHENQIGTGRLHPSVELYATSKLWSLSASEQLLDNWDHLVLANMYGPYDNITHERSHLVGGMLNKFLTAQSNRTNVQLIGTGIAKRDLIFVEDVCDIIEFCINNPGANQAMNVSTGIGTTVFDLAELIKDILNFDGEIIWGSEKDDGALNKVLGTKVIDKLYPNRTKTNIRDGLQKTIPYFKHLLGLDK